MSNQPVLLILTDDAESNDRRNRHQFAHHLSLNGRFDPSVVPGWKQHSNFLKKKLSGGVAGAQPLAH